MHENKIKKETKNKEKLDSISIGSPSSGGAVKLYCDLAKLSDEEAKDFALRVVGLHKYMLSLK